jgi:serine/threonine protein kinase
VSYCEKALKLTYEDYLQRGETIENINIEQYLVYNQIGKGSNGHVYRGMDDRTKNQVAIKLMDLRKINAEDKIVVKLIKQRLSESEPKLMYQCNSPNLVKCYDVFRNEDLKVLVLEYCNGGTLQAEI